MSSSTHARLLPVRKSDAKEEDVSEGELCKDFCCEIGVLGHEDFGLQGASDFLPEVWFLRLRILGIGFDGAGWFAVALWGGRIQVTGRAEDIFGRGGKWDVSRRSMPKPDKALAVACCKELLIALAIPSKLLIPQLEALSAICDCPLGKPPVPNMMPLLCVWLPVPNCGVPAENPFRFWPPEVEDIPNESPPPLKMLPAEEAPVEF